MRPKRIPACGRTRARHRRALRLPHFKHVAFVLDPHAPVAAYELLAGDGQHELAVRGSVSEEPRAGAVVEPSNDDALLRLALPVEDDGVSFDRRIAFGPLDERRALGCVDLSLVDSSISAAPVALGPPAAVNARRMLRREPAEACNETIFAGRLPNMLGHRRD